MVLILRTMDYLGMNAVDVEFVTSSITTWAPKINMIVSSISMGMTVSLIPTIVSAFTLKKWDEVNNKLNQALQMIERNGGQITENEVTIKLSISSM